MDASPREQIEAAYEAILSHLPVDDIEGTRDTPRRAAAALLELTGGYNVDVESLFTTFDSSGYDEMIAVDPIPFASLCEHHILPFVGKAYVVYLPNGRVVGLSKIPRLVDAFARRLQIQERLTLQIADALERHVKPLGVMVLLEAEHACCTQRGIRSSGTMMSTSVTRGAMRTKPATRAEAEWLLRRRAA